MLDFFILNCLLTLFEDLQLKLFLICVIFYNCSVLSEDATKTQTFDALALSLHHYFNKQDYFKVGTALVSTIVRIIKTCTVLRGYYIHLLIKQNS